MIREPAHLRYQIFSDGKLRTPASSTSDRPIGYQGQRSRCSVVYELAGAIRSFSVASPSSLYLPILVPQRSGPGFRTTLRRKPAAFASGSGLGIDDTSRSKAGVEGSLGRAVAAIVDELFS